MRKIVLAFAFLTFNIPFLLGQEINKEDISKDIDEYVNNISSLHVNPFSNVAKEYFLKTAEVLKKSSDTLNINQLIVGMMKLNGLLKDEHTDIDFNQKIIVPLSFYWFEEGIIAVKTLKEDSFVLGSKLISINNIKIDTLVNELKSLTGVNTISAYKAKVISMLSDPVIIFGLGSNTTNEEINYTFLKSGSEKINLKLAPVKKSKDTYTTLRPAVPAISSSNKLNYWLKYLPEKNILFVQYNRCKEDPDYPFKVFVDEFKKLVETNKPEKLIIDLRYNGGGNSNLFKPFLQAVSSMKELKNKKIYTLIGRKTYSSAVINAWQLQTKANSKVLGEESGGKLNHTGEVKTFKLKNSGIDVYYSSNEFFIDASQMGGIKPDVEIKNYLDEYLKGIDPAIKFIEED